MDVDANALSIGLTAEITTASIEPNGEYPTNVDLDFEGDAPGMQESDLAWSAQGGTPASATGSTDFTTKFASAGDVSVDFTHTPTNTTAGVDMRIVDPSCQITRSSPWTGEGIVRSTIPTQLIGTFWVLEGSSVGFWAEQLKPITFTWTTTVGTTTHTNSEWDFGDQFDQLSADTLLMEVADDGSPRRYNFALSVTDHFGHAASHSEYSVVYPKISVEKTSETRNPRYSTWVRTGSVRGTNGQPPQTVSFAYGTSEAAQRSWSSTSSVGVDLKLDPIRKGGKSCK